MKTIAIRWFFAALMLIFVWRGERWALYLTVMLLAIACEVQALAIELLANRKGSAK